jgi:hypothetical protein
VRDALITNNFVTADECTPIVTLESLPAGAELLDASVYPLPRFSQWFEDDKLNRIRPAKPATRVRLGMAKWAGETHIAPVE